jgi:3-oxoacyl-[acyl-carrier protein] reductase
MASHLSKGVAIVTGGSRGIGRGIVLALAHEGFRVVINFISNEEAARLLESEVSRLGQEAMIAQADVTRADQVSAMVASVAGKLGAPSLLINNVGPFLMKSVNNSTEKEWSDIIRGNLTSAFLCAKAVRDHLRETKGSIIFIGGPNGDQLRAAPHTAAYTIAKNGIVTLAKTLAKEEASYGVRVNVINPGFVDNGSIPGDEIERQAKQVPLGRVGTPKDIAEAVLFLASEKASYITGSVLNVSGGLWI